MDVKSRAGGGRVIAASERGCVRSSFPPPGFTRLALRHDDAPQMERKPKSGRSRSPDLVPRYAAQELVSERRKL